MRYLANVDAKAEAVRPSVLGRTERRYLQSGQTLRLLARVKDSRGAASDATVTVTAAQAGKDAAGDAGKKSVALQPTPTAGVYEGAFAPDKAGAYTLRFTAADPSGKELGSDDLPLVVAQTNLEAERIARDDQTLRAIADRSHGRYAELAGLPDVIDLIIARAAGLADAPKNPTIVRLYDFTLGFLLFVSLLTAEWFLRRHWQLQ